MLRDVFVEGNLLVAVPPPPEAVAVARLVDRDPVNPGPKTRLAAEPVDGAEHAEEDFLGEVQRFVAIAEQVHRELNDHPLVLADELSAGRFVSRRAALNQRRFSTADLRPAGDACFFH